MYLGCWFPTATTGRRDIEAHYSVPSRPIAPLFLATDFYESLSQNGTPPKIVTQRTRIFYFWFFGWTAKLGMTQGLHDPPAR
jgi:hypothetical protein